MKQFHTRYLNFLSMSRSLAPLALGLLAILLNSLLAYSAYAAPVSTAKNLKNKLNNHPSPYLALHGSDPVAWQTWSNKIFDRARRENKLVYVSIGYFSCHWCHVMQKESYKNPAIAAVLNKYFIPVKVDRELHPALDNRLLEFIQSTRGYSGWPANVFITPEGYPLVGMVYVKPKNFLEILKKLHKQWGVQSTALGKLAKDASTKQTKTELSLGSDIAQGLGKKYIENFIKISMKSHDDLNGGFGQKSKFPNVPQLKAVLSYVKRTNNKKARNMLKLTLDRMASQGLRDHIRGGFSRYTVDTQWQTPHFEKMLYDNAQLAEIYLLASVYFKNSYYEQVARNTLDFLLNDMADKSGAFISSLSALDNKGVEGGYYLWDQKQLAKLLTAQELKLVKNMWSMQNAPTLSGHLPVQTLTQSEAAKKFGLTKSKVANIIRRVKTKLLKAQKSRRIPRDTKVLAAWNGLALKTFSMAGRLKGGEKYKKAAQSIRNYIINSLWRKNLARSVVAGKPLGTAGLQDYAQVSNGLYAWSKYHEPKDKKLVEKIVKRGWKLFYSKNGWQLAKNMVPGFAAREAMISDRALASPSASLIRVTLKLAEETGNKVLTNKAKTALNVAHKTLDEDPWWFATHIRTLYEMQK